MSAKYTHTLVIIFNEFHADVAHKYVEIIAEADGSVVKEIELKRRPRAARFDEVYENGSGSHNHWNAHRAQRLYSHPLQRR